MNPVTRCIMEQSEYWCPSDLQNTLSDSLGFCKCSRDKHWYNLNRKDFWQKGFSPERADEWDWEVWKCSEVVGIRHKEHFLNLHVCLLMKGWASALGEEQPWQSSAGSTDLCTSCHMCACGVQGQFCFVCVLLHCQCTDTMCFAACGYIWFLRMMYVFSVTWWHLWHSRDISW